MAVEGKRGCGYRKVGGLYLCADGPAEVCHRLPFPLEVCPTCHQGIKQARGWTWISSEMFKPGCTFGEVYGVSHCPWCPICNPLCLERDGKPGQLGLIWIGARFYKTAEDFRKESVLMGISRRIRKVPRGFKLGETYVCFAHPEGAPARKPAEKPRPAIFQVCRPSRLELILKESDATEERIQKEMEKGITVVKVPDNDKDHQGSAYDKEEDPGKEDPSAETTDSERGLPDFADKPTEVL